MHSDEQHDGTVESQKVIAQNRVEEEDERTQCDQQSVTSGADEKKS